MNKQSYLVLILLGLTPIFGLFAQSPSWNWAHKFQGEFDFKRKALQFQEGLAPVQKERLWGFVDTSGTLAIGCEFQEVKAFSQGRAAAMLNNLWGFIDKKGTWIVPPQYKDVQSYSEGFAAVKDGKRWGFINREAKLVVACEYRDIRPFSEGLAAVNDKLIKGWGFIDTLGRILIATNHFYVESFRYGRALVHTSDGYYGFLDKKGAIAIEPKFHQAGRFSENIAKVYSKTEKKWAYINTFGELLTEYRYEKAEDFHEGRAAIRVNGKWGFIQKDGGFRVFPIYKEVQSFSNGLAAVRENWKWAFVDRDGRVVIPEQFQDALCFSEGYCFVRQKGNWGLLTYKGAKKQEKPEPKKEKIIKPKPQPNVPLAKLFWDLPSTKNSSSKNNVCQIKACIRSESPIEEFSLYLNGEIIDTENRGFSVEDDCDYTLDTKILLKKGRNEIYCIFTNAGGESKSEKRTIEYGEAKQGKTQYGGKNYALLIAINDYEDHAINDLKQPVKDAEKLRNVLMDKYQFSNEHITLLADGDKEEIMEELQELRKKLQEEDQVLIFYAGHGLEKNGAGYWLPSDADPQNTYNWLSYAELVKDIRSFRSKHVLVVADACYSGSMVLRDAAMQEKTCELLNQKMSRHIMTSGAKEAVPDQSVFIKYFIKTLEENEYSCMSSEELFSRLKQPVIYNSPNNQIPQYGVIPQTNAEGGDFIFYRQ